MEVLRERTEAQNLARHRGVPAYVLDLHYARLARTLEALPLEGYDDHHGRPGEGVRLPRIAQ